MAIELTIIVTTKDGKILDTLYVNGDYLKGVAAYPEEMLAETIKEALQENFEVRVGK